MGPNLKQSPKQSNKPIHGLVFYLAVNFINTINGVYRLNKQVRQIILLNTKIVECCTVPHVSLTTGSIVLSIFSIEATISASCCRTATIIDADAE